MISSANPQSDQPLIPSGAKTPSSASDSSLADNPPVSNSLSNVAPRLTSPPAGPKILPAAPCARPGRAKPRRSRPRSRIPSDLSAANLVAIVDSREQNPLDLQPLRQVAGTLATGDYSLRGLETVIAIERKSLADLLGCVGQARDRFHREVLRLLAYPVRALVVESTWPELERGQWRSKVSPPAALGTVLNWISMGLPVIMAGDHNRAGRYVSRILFVAARRRWREARSLLPPG